MRVNQPRPYFILFDADFWQPGRSSFGVWTEPGMRFSPAARTAATQPGVPRAAILAQLLEDDLAFWRLERTNCVDIHPVTGGLYDDAIYHIGAASRAPRLRSDPQTCPISNPRLRELVTDRFDSLAQNIVIEQTLPDHDRFTDELAGGARQVFRPILTGVRALGRELAHTPRAQRRTSADPPIPPL